MSRQPPLPRGPPPSGLSHCPKGRSGSSERYRPHGLPPRPNEVDSYRRGNASSSSRQFHGDDNYSYTNNYIRYDRSPSPHHHRGDGYRPRYESRRMSDDRYRPETARSRRDRTDPFTFRYDSPSGLDYGQAQLKSESYASRSTPRRYESVQDRRQGATHREPQRDNYRGRGRGRVGSRMASDREFLHTKRAPTPELMSGMDDDARNPAKYVPLDDVSDSDEVEMDLSEDEIDGQAKKKIKLASTEDSASVPRWSNPDPYTALPPPDESQKKKRDVVKLIRKARVVSENSNKPKASSDDFISLDLEDDVILDRNFAPTNPRTGSLNEVGQIFEKRNHEFPMSVPVGPRAPGTAPHEQYVARTGGSRQDDGPRSSSGQNSSVIDTALEPILGSRKRSTRDNIKQPPKIYENGVREFKDTPSGVVVKAWLPLTNVSSCPWVIDHSDTPKMGVWLHKEIMDFYHFVKPQRFEQTIRAKLIEDLQQRVRSYVPQANILPFGSFPAGLYLPTADLDLVLVSNRYMESREKVFGSNRDIYRLGNFLSREKVVQPGSLEPITKAKVPILKYIDSLTGLRVDISFENDTGLVANNTFQSWKNKFPCMPILVTLIKHFLAMRGLNEPVNGGIGGFSITCLVVSLLQNMPQVQSRSMIPEHHLGEILMEFFDLYGNRFNTTTTAITLDPPGYVQKDLNVYSRRPLQKFSIIDPNNPDNDISGGSKNTAAILKSFQTAYKTLQRRMGELLHSDNRCSVSILDCIIGGNYTSFKLQREHLAHIHEKIIGPVD